MAYVYKGDRPFIPGQEDKPKPPKPKKPRPKSKVRPYVCGTHRAYARHLRNGEPTDPACKSAEATHGRNKYRAKKAATQ